MSLVELDDRARLAAFFSRRPAVHAYGLGDLDPFFWPYVTWFGLERAGTLEQVAFLYAEHEPPTVIALAEPPEETLRDLLQALAPRLPDRFELHVTESALSALAPGLMPVRGPFRHVKMELRDDELLDAAALAVEVLGRAQLAETEALYAAAYPGSWFHERRFETGRYVATRVEGRLACVAGVHVHAPELGIAALGDVATDPALRGRGLAAGTCAALCLLLRADGCTTIALNVREDNEPAIRAYRRIGFEVVERYLELTAAREAPRP